ncbi:albusnodin/ikarugamycin family macrolactam cyclase [Nocardioides sp. NPDC057767]|uniref:albusnodin/ikarugamycin family macrolactam cyclase n=1 Tax=unclassified Nocardioides TaxID=2615069 RepID=UPI00332971FB
MAGYIGNHSRPRSPLGARPIAAKGTSIVWAVDEHGTHASAAQQYRLVRDRAHDLILIGTTSVADAELTAVAASSVPDNVTWRWPGAYAVVEQTESHLSVWSDLATAVPIYTCLADEGVYWSTTARGLAGLASDGEHRLDLERVAGELHAPGTPRLFGERTYFDGVRLVLPGHRYMFGRSGTAWRSRMWVPGERHGSEPSGPAGLRAELTAAVRSRVENAIAPSADLSGGLDSTALTLLAARALAHSGRRISAYTVHEPSANATGEPTGDLAHALRAGQHPGIEHHLLALDGAHLPYGRLDGLPATDEPAPSARAYARFAFQLNAMRERTATDCHMTGDGGDTVLMTSVAWIADAITHRRFAVAAAEARRLARLRRTAPAEVLRAATDLLRHTPEQGLAAAAAWWHSGHATKTQRSAAAAWLTLAAPPPWATGQARLHAAALANVAPALPHARGALTAHAIVHDTAEVGRTALSDAQLAAHHGVPLHNPFVDSRVLAAVLSMPVAAMPRPSEYKPQIREALADVYPPELAARTTKGSFTSDYFAGLRTNLSPLLDLADGRLSELGLVDVDALRASLRAGAAGATGAAVCLPQLDTALGLESWLRALERTAVVRWERQAIPAGAIS